MRDLVLDLPEEVQVLEDYVWNVVAMGGGSNFGLGCVMALVGPDFMCKASQDLFFERSHHDGAG